MLWWDREQAVNSNLYNSFLDKIEIKLYQMYSEIKVSIAERVIRTVKTYFEKIKTQYLLKNLEFDLIEKLPVVLKRYNKVDIHSTIGLTPSQDSDLTNFNVVQKRYELKYKNYDPVKGY